MKGGLPLREALPNFAVDPLRAVARLTQADNGTVISDFPVADPWDKSRKPRERIL
jgi:hypothetical protein